MDTSQIAEMEESWLDHVVALLPERLKSGRPESVQKLGMEMKEDYMMSVKKAIVEFVLHDQRQTGHKGEDENDDEHRWAVAS